LTTICVLLYSMWNNCSSHKSLWVCREYPPQQLQHFRVSKECLNQRPFIGPHCLSCFDIHVDSSLSQQDSHVSRYCHVLCCCVLTKILINYGLEVCFYPLLLILSSKSL
jgi:hypothetical protein